MTYIANFIKSIQQQLIYGDHLQSDSWTKASQLTSAETNTITSLSQASRAPALVSSTATVTNSKNPTEENSYWRYSAPPVSFSLSYGHRKHTSASSA